MEHSVFNPGFKADWEIYFHIIVGLSYHYDSEIWFVFSEIYCFCFSRHYFEANQNMQNYHRLFLLSQERYDRLANLAGSGGASELKDADILDPAFVDIELLRNSGCNSQYQDVDDNDRGKAVYYLLHI